LNTVGAFQCCDSGYQRDVKGLTCVDINECDTGGWVGTCTSKDACVNTKGSFFCCPAGLTNVADACADIDECTTGLWSQKNSSNTGAPCLSFDSCVNRNGSFICCDPGFTKDFENGETCVDIDECSTGLWSQNPSNNTRMPCISQDACVNTIGSFECCSVGYTRGIRANMASCVDIDECATGLWSQRNSANTQRPCGSQDVCLNIIGSFECCASGYARGSQGNITICVDIDECATGLWSQKVSANTERPCVSQDACININGSFNCCPSGYTKDLQSQYACVDVDECATGLWSQKNSSNTGGPCVSQDVCINEAGTFSCCPAGYTRDFTELNACKDIDECSTGLWIQQNSNNTGAPCPSQDSCQNFDGSFNCCPAGYHRDFSNPNGPCVDINECLQNTIHCNRSDLCVNTAGSFKCCPENETNVAQECHPCFDDFEALPYPRTTLPFPGLAPFLKKPIAQYEFDWQSCTECNGLRFYSRKQYSPYCSGSGTKIDQCGYACPNQTLVKTAELVISTLRTEFTKYDFLQNIVSILFNTTITIKPNTKRAAGLSIGVPCGANTADIQALIQSLAQDIVPNGNTMQFTPHPTTCQLEISSADATAGIDIGLIIGLVVGITVFLLLIALLFLKMARRSKLAALPKEVAWSFKLFEDALPFTWDYRGTKSAGYHYLDLEPKSSEYRKAAALFSSFGEYEFEITGITAVYNSLLLTNFSNTYLIQRERNRTNPIIFGAKSWRDTENMCTSEWVFKKYTALCAKYAWNIETDTMIIPACHGTNQSIAEKICETGFASLSSLDAGYFGKGIYFTTFSMYCVPYIAPKKQPTIIVSYLLPGNVYPVIEKVDGPNSLLGAAIKNGFNSHFVVTDRAGKCVDGGAEIFNEIIISQESQIVPAFIVSTTKASLRELLKAWKRQVPVLPDRERETQTDLTGTETEDDRHDNRFSITDGVVYSDITMARQAHAQQPKSLFGVKNFETV